MRVQLMDSVYDMTDTQFKDFLRTIKGMKAVNPLGIYAISKGNTAVVLKESYKTKFELKRAVREYNKHGMRVYYNAD